MKLLYLANAVITILVGGIIFCFSQGFTVAKIINILLLLLTLEIPSIYFFFLRVSKLNRNDNELLAPGIVTVGFIFLTDAIVYTMALCVEAISLEVLALYTVIFHCIMGALLLVIKGLTDYIRKQH